MSRDAFIVEAVRTPIGRGHREKGIFREVHPAELLGRTFVELLGLALTASAWYWLVRTRLPVHPVAAFLGSLLAGFGLGMFTAIFGALVSPAHTTAAAFLVLLAVLVLRPKGLAAR